MHEAKSNFQSGGGGGVLNRGPIIKVAGYDNHVRDTNLEPFARLISINFVANRGTHYRITFRNEEEILIKKNKNARLNISC